MRFTEDGVTYQLRDDNTLEIVGIAQDIKHAVIQPFVNNYPVTRVAFKAACENNNLLSITLPKTVKDIGIKAFCKCEQLSEVYFAANKVSLQSDAFIGCQNLRRVNGCGIRMEGPGVFCGCTSLEEINAICHHNITAISFEHCMRLTEIICGQDVVIHDDAFIGCVSLEKFTFIGDAIVSRDMWAFISKKEVYCPEDSRFAEMAYSGTKVVLV